MKRKLIIALIVICCVILVATLIVVLCIPKKITVAFDPNYSGAKVETLTGRKGDSFVAPSVQRDDYDFDGWYRSADCSGTPQSFPVKLKANTTFYAKWKEATPEPPDGETVLTSVSAVYTGGSIAIGTQPNKSLLTVTAHYSDGSSKEVTNFNVGTVDSSSAGEAQWEISYRENGVTKSCFVTVKVSSGQIADMSIHFINLGSNSGDSIYIKAGDTDILIDAGAVGNSANTIRQYVNMYCTDGVLEYVIATHADSDHIAAFVGTTTQAGILDTYKCENIIRFAKTNKSTNVVTNFLAKCEEQKQAGANYYTALECYNNENDARRVYDIADGITMEVLYQNYYTQNHSKENNYSVVLLFTQGDNHYLFTGDLEAVGETSLVNSNPNLPQVELYKAGHHGSDTSSNDNLLSVIKPKYVVVSCGTGDSYGFPKQDFINRVAPYTDKVYVTGMNANVTGYGTMNGNVVFSCKNGVISVECSLRDTLLKDTEWFVANRTCPAAWA